MSAGTVVHTGYTVSDLATRWACSTHTATEIIYGLGGFVDRGYVEAVGDRVVVTEKGIRASRAVQEFGL